MPPIQTFNFQEEFVQVTTHAMLGMQTQLAGGAMSLQRTAHRTFHSWDWTSVPLTRAEREDLFGFYHYHLGNIPFWYAGGDAGDIQNQALFGFGDGTTTDFFLPNNHITNGTVTVYEDGTPQAGVTITDATGLVSFTVAPSNNVKLTAIYQCTFKVFFETGQAEGPQTERLALETYRVKLKMREFPNG